MLNQIFDSFIEASAVSVMFRGTLENVFAAKRLDAIFERHAQKQVVGQLAFSTCAELLGLVTTRIRPSVNAAYVKRTTEVGVSIKSVYNKLNGIELAVSEAFVRETASDLKVIIEAMNATLAGPLPGYDVRIVDGNHLAGTDHRIAELRHLGDAVLPGHTVAVLNPHVELIEVLISCEDGHANQRSKYQLLLDHVQRGQCWIADRDYSIKSFLWGIKNRNGYFLIRQHGKLQGTPIGPRKPVGTTETGIVHEQSLRLTNDNDETFTMRRITVTLDTPTRDGDSEIHLLTNLPKSVDAHTVADAYRRRWTIETAFAKLTDELRCELNTLGYPKAALFSFGVAVVMYNALHAVIAAMRVKHPEVSTSQLRHTGKERTFSFYYLADEVSGVWRGMDIAIPADHWHAAFASLTPKQMAKQLLQLASHVNVKHFLTNPYSPKTRSKKPKVKTRAGHVSTYQILQQRKKKPSTKNAES